MEVQEKLNDGAQLVDPNGGAKDLHMHSNTNDFGNGENSMDVENALARNGQNASNDIFDDVNNEENIES